MSVFESVRHADPNGRGQGTARDQGNKDEVAAFWWGLAERGSIRGGGSIGVLMVVGRARPTADLGDGAVNTSLALHTAARRYCLERYAYWRERYAEIDRMRGRLEPDGYHYTPEALATFPRYNVLNAIRIEVERIEPADLPSVEDTRRLLVLAGESAQDDFTARRIGDIEQRAMAEERSDFCRYVVDLTVSDLSSVEDLPYRRVLTAQESKTIWSRLRSRWEISEGYWFPLAECALPDVVAFKTNPFYKAAVHERLRGILASRGIEHLWELREFGPEYEEALALFAPYYGEAEGYWSSGGMDWIIYASHERSVTVGGSLLDELKAMWPSWQAHVWTGAFD